MDFVMSSAVAGLLGWAVVILTYFGKLPPLLGYPVGGALVAIHLLVLFVGVKSVRDFKRRPPPSSSIRGKRGVVVETSNSWALVKIEGTYWRVHCPTCVPGEIVEVVDVGDVGLVVKKT